MDAHAVKRPTLELRLPARVHSERAVELVTVIAAIVVPVALPRLLDALVVAALELVAPAVEL